MEWISFILIIVIGLSFIFFGLKYNSSKHEQTKKEAQGNLDTKKAFEYKYLAMFVQKVPWWVGRVFFVSIGIVILLLALFGKSLFV